MNPKNNQEIEKDNMRKISTPEKTIRFLEYLRKNTDKDNTVKLQDIMAAFNGMGLNPGTKNTVRKFIREVADTYNLDAEQHQLPQSEWRIVFDDYVKKYGDFSDDEEDEIDEESDRESMYFRNLYYVPVFSYEEIDALIEAVQFSRTLTTKETEKIIRTLEEQFASNFYRRSARGICKIHEKAGYDRELLRKNLLTIQQAIDDGVQIEYRFNGYSHDKKLVPMGNYKRKASPYYIVADNGRYYLLAAHEQYKNVMIVRIDLMTEVEIPDRKEAIGKPGIRSIPKSEVKGLPQEWDADFPMKHLNMSYDAPIPMKLRVKSEKSAQNRRERINPDYTFLHDYFGDNYRYLKVDEKDPDYDIVKVECSVFGMVNFALQYADKLEVLEPSEVRDEIRKKVEMLQKNYLMKE